MKKTLTLVLSLALAVAIGIGGTLAYLTSKTQTISNTFTIGSVAVSLYETDKEGNKVTNGIQYTVAPGQSAKKDPTIEVTSEDDAWVFIGFNNSSTVINHDGINEGWTQVGTFTEDSVTYTVYGYNSIVEKDGTATLFDNINFSDSISGNTVSATETIDGSAIKVIGFGVQTEGFDTAQSAWNAPFGAPANP